MALRVPRNPQTSVPTRQMATAQAVPGLDVRPITQAIDAFRAKMDEDRRDKQKFDANRRLMDEATALQADLEARRRDPNIGLDTFAETTNQAYTERHRALVDELYQEGFDEDVLEDLDSRLATVRQGMFGNALQHQVTGLRSRAEGEIDEYGLRASQLATSNPDAWTSVEEDIRETVSLNPYLTEQEKAVKTDELIGIARQGAGKAYALQRPDEVIRLLDPQGFTAPPSVGGGATGTINVAGLDANRSAVATTLATELPPPVVAGFLANFDVEAGYEGGQGDGGTASGIAQWRLDRRDRFKTMFGVDPHEATKEQQAQFVLWEMQNPGAAGMSVAGRDAILNASTAEEAAALIDEHYERSSGEHRSQRVANAAKYSSIQTIDPGASTAEQAPALDTITAPQPIVAGNLPLTVQQKVDNVDGTVSTVRTISIGTDAGEVLIPTVIGGQVISDEEAIRHYEETGENFGTFETAEDATAYAEELHRRHEAALAPATTIADVQTGVPILDALNGPERLQVLGWAREQTNRVAASQKAAMDVTIGNITAEAMNNGGEVATPIPSDAEILAIYGPVEGPQRIAQVTQSVNTGKAVQAFRTQSASAIQAGVDALEPVPGSPTYETELQIYSAAQRAASALMTERDSDPAAYAMKYFPGVGRAAEQGTAQYYAELDRVYAQLGIDPNYAPVLPGPAMEKVVADYKIMTPAQRRQYIQQNYSAMGEDRFKRFATGMDGTTIQDDIRIYALMRDYRGAPGEWENVYQQVLEGREVMQQDPARRPSSQAIREQFRDAAFSAIGNLNAQASRAVQEAASALYVMRGGDPQKIDSKLYRESLATALGGSIPANMGKGRATDYTILPPKVSETQFENWVDGLGQGELTLSSVERTPPLYGDLRTPVLLDDIRDQGVFVMTSPGRYMIKMASDGKPLMTATGRPFLVNIDSRSVR